MSLKFFYRDRVLSSKKADFLLVDKGILEEEKVETQQVVMLLVEWTKGVK